MKLSGERPEKSLNRRRVKEAEYILLEKKCFKKVERADFQYWDHNLWMHK